MSAECMHCWGSYCVVCRKLTNSCCGPDLECSKCCSQYCCECSKKKLNLKNFTPGHRYDIDRYCLVCNKIADNKICSENITDDQIRDYIFKTLDKEKIKRSIRRETIEQLINKEYLDTQRK